MNTTEKPKPLPDLEDPDNGRFWQATAEGKLLVRRCADCGKPHWPPRLGCPHCGSAAVDWADAPTRGTVFSWTVVHRAQTPGFAGEVPYAVLLVALDGMEGCRMIGNLTGAGVEDIRADMPVEAVFTPSPDGSVTLVNWRPV